MDLIDYTNRPIGGFSKVLVVVDNLSRYMITRPLRSKETRDVAPALASAFKEIKTKFGGAPVYSLLDNGPEWRGESVQAFKDAGIERRLSPGGVPQAQALVERALGTLKLVMARQKDVTGQGWSALLATATRVKNEMYHRTLKASPNEALKWDEPTRQAFRKRVIQSNAIQGGAYERAALLEEGSKVRVRLVKGALSKQSDPSFSDQIFTVSDVIKCQKPAGCRCVPP